MKITNQDYQKLKSFIESHKGEIEQWRIFIYQNRKVKDFEMALRWELYHQFVKDREFTDSLYKYLNDSHIDTALKQIMKELENTERTELEKEYLIQQAKIEFNG